MMKDNEGQLHFSKPTAFIEVKIFGDASRDIYSRMTKKLTAIYGDILGVSPDRMYIRYFGSEKRGYYEKI
ncbi:MAG: hypothetical protein K6F28_07490 [Lachnospiraceae bacterium]|nr:hypothetical protein [Lachnospiraceae bacterium]